MIELKDVSFSYRTDLPVLSHIDLTIEEGETVGIVGANGAGKSTLLKLLVGLIFPQEGTIQIDGETVGRKNLSVIRQKIGYVFQDSDTQLFMPTVEKDVGFAPKNYGFSDEEVKRRVERALQAVGIEDLAARSILELSGGQKKLVSLATVLSLEPEVLLFDEPTIALDPRNRRKFIEMFPELPGTKIIVSHDLDLVLETCNRTILISDGRITADDDTTVILNHKELLEENGLELPILLQGRQRSKEGMTNEDTVY